jgi:hypothetical protein
LWVEWLVSTALVDLKARSRLIQKNRLFRLLDLRYAVTGQKSTYRTAVINGRDTTYARDQLVLGKEEFARSEVLGKKEAERRPETM